MLRKGFSIPVGNIYLGDAGYGLTNSVITPYRGVRFHLREWSLGNQRPQNAKELYNLRHAQQRNCIERIFGVLKKRFPILVSSPEYPFSCQVKLVDALCALHNIIMGSEQDSFFLEKAEDAIEMRARRYRRRVAGGALRQRTPGPDHYSAAAGRMRDEIASAMWIQYQQCLQERLD
jgi:hypothetical protein